TGGLDGRRPEKPIFMFYDWLPGGWGGRNGKDGCNVTTACFGTGLMSQPVEGQERANPILTTEYEILTDSAGPGKWRGGAGVRKTSVMLEAEKAVISYICDRERAVVWGIEGGLPSIPHGLSITRAGAAHEEWLGSGFSAVPIGESDVLSPPRPRGRWLRRSAGARPGRRAAGRCRRLCLRGAGRHGLRRGDQGHRRGDLRLRHRRSRHQSRARDDPTPAPRLACHRSRTSRGGLSRRQDRQARRGASLRRGARLGQRHAV